ncbi:MAG: hypothetical protein ABEI74_01475 [Candidatus Pacearchaeota archaeon]
MYNQLMELFSEHASLIYIVFGFGGIGVLVFLIASIGGHLKHILKTK